MRRRVSPARKARREDEKGKMRRVDVLLYSPLKQLPSILLTLPEGHVRNQNSTIAFRNTRDIVAPRRCSSKNSNPCGEFVYVGKYTRHSSKCYLSHEYFISLRIHECISESDLYSGDIPNLSRDTIKNVRLKQKFVLLATWSRTNFFFDEKLHDVLVKKKRRKEAKSFSFEHMKLSALLAIARNCDEYIFKGYYQENIPYRK